MLWMKAFHLISMVTWFSGLFYLPRLFVYHAMTTDTISNERFKIMERKLYYGIMTPGAWMTILSGLWMLYSYAWQMNKAFLWLHLKLALVIILVFFHLYCGHVRRQFQRDQNKHGHVFYRWLNEFPTLILIAIVCLAVIRPF